MVDVMPILLFGMVSAAAYLGFRQLRRETARVVARNKRAEAETRTGAHGTLERDLDGVYRLRRD
ncbi:hypothetical protein [Aureimonas sp. ME7]|uniref:hypothetical protein n=1 Tax=Aureimonas sp. ME7 TaxID=2744252 RepID=UPI0015F62A5C|nr:hypothetical protein [Aureimonas sp. ME7]